MDIYKQVKENRVLIGLTAITIIGVLIFNVNYYTQAYGIVEINSINALLLVPFIVLVCALGYLLGTSKQRYEFEQAYHKRITSREREVIALIVEGKKNKEIADVLFVDVSTIKSHINSIYRKTGVSNRQSLIAIGDEVLAKG